MLVKQCQKPSPISPFEWVVCLPFPNGSPSDCSNNYGARELQKRSDFSSESLRFRRRQGEDPQPWWSTNRGEVEFPTVDVGYVGIVLGDARWLMNQGNQKARMILFSSGNSQWHIYVSIKCMVLYPSMAAHVFFECSTSWISSCSRQPPKKPTGSWQDKHGWKSANICGKIIHNCFFSC